MTTEQRVGDVDPLTLPSLPLRENRNLPECPAVYFVLDSENKILYIGKASNLAQRWSSHHRWSQLVQMGDGIRITWLECSELALLPEIESALIKHFSPTLNRTSVPSTPSAKSPTLNIIISETDKERLRQLAVTEKRSMSQLAAIAIQEYLDKHKVPTPNTTEQEGAA